MLCENVCERLIILRENKLTIMDTNLKNAIAAMREEIAALEKEQKAIKPQRKTVHFDGERTMHPWEAYCKVLDNKERLRILYAAYNLLRGKNFDVTEKNAKPLIYDWGMYYTYPQGIKGQHYTRYEWLDGKHPLCEYLSLIENVLDNYDYKFKNHETEKDCHGYEYKTVSPDKYEEIVYIGE